jgi:hypothetical protein
LNLWHLLTLACLGMFICHLASNFAIQMEKDADRNFRDLNLVYPLTVVLAFAGIFLSVFSWLKIVREINVPKFKQANI